MLNEMAHLIPFLVLLAVAVYAFSIRESAAGLVFLILNIPVNLYPVFLMRLNRIRIARVLGWQPDELLNQLLDSK